MKDIEIANICCQEGISQNDVSKCCFQISETRLLRNILKKNIKTGLVEQNGQSLDLLPNQSNKVIRTIKRSRLQIFFWIRNCIWKFGKWKSKELNDFIDDFNPDIIFAQLQDKIYLNNLIGYVQGYTKKPLVLYAWDDIYSLKQFSISPLFWIDRLIQRQSIRKLVSKCSFLYTISKEQKEEYARTLKIQTGLLYKGKIFEKMQDIANTDERILKILYTGNLYSGRYNTLQKLCKSLEEYNKNKLQAQIYIYSGSDLTNSQIQKLNRGNSSFFKGKISEEEVRVLQSQADVLLHIEPMSLKGSLLCRLSFSTKLVDYFYNAKCIFAVGSGRCSAMKYLKRYDAAIISENNKEAVEKMKEVINSPNLVKEYAEKSWNCGYNNHQIQKIQSELRSKLKKLVQETE